MGYDIVEIVCDALDLGFEVIVPKGSVVSDGFAKCTAEASFFRDQKLFKNLNELL